MLPCNFLQNYFSTFFIVGFRGPPRSLEFSWHFLLAKCEKVSNFEIKFIANVQETIIE